MGLKTYFSDRPSRRTPDNNNILYTNKKLPTTKSTMVHKRNASDVVHLRFRKIFNIRRRDGSTSSHDVAVPPAFMPSVPRYVAPSAAVLESKTLYCFRSPKQKTVTVIKDKKKTGPESSPASSSELPVTKFESAAPSHSSTPPITASFMLKAPRNKQVQPEHAITKPSETPKAPQHTELEAAMAAMRAAEKVLDQRHAAMKPQPNIGKKIKPLEALIKTASPTVALDRSPDASHLPSTTSPTNNRPQQQSSTANEACASYQRRQFLKDLVNDAARGCPTAISVVDRLNVHFALKARHPQDRTVDISMNVDGVLIRSSQLGFVEHTWIARYNALVNNTKLVDRRLLSLEDSEVISTQLLPEERRVILKPEHFEIFVMGLGEEGILTKAQAKSIARLGVTTEEFDQGPHFTGTSKHVNRTRPSPDMLLIFEMPGSTNRSAPTFSSHPAVPKTRPDLYPHLLTLIEAAVYAQIFWHGYFFANARSKLSSFHAAFTISQSDTLLPPTLTAYQRIWTFREQRLLQRGQLIADLLGKYEAGVLTDFGIVRVIRATYIPLPAQPLFSPEDLESFLYARTPDSGLAPSTIPSILALHPEHDAAFAQPQPQPQHGAQSQRGANVLAALKERAAAFEKEEKQRLSEIEISCGEFQKEVWRGLGVWGKCGVLWRRVTGRKGVGRPFDPFAEGGGGCEIDV